MGERQDEDGTEEEQRGEDEQESRTLPAIQVVFGERDAKPLAHGSRETPDEISRRLRLDLARCLGTSSSTSAFLCTQHCCAHVEANTCGSAATAGRISTDR